MAPDLDLAAVDTAIREVTAAEILPRFRRLAADEVIEKSPGDLVTAADQQAEIALTALLRDIVDVPVVGEEAVAADPSLLAVVEEPGAIWIVDPVDGTSNFVKGSDDFAVMVALVEHGRPVASWIHHPIAGVTYRAARGEGAWRDDQRLAVPDAGPAAGSGLDAATVVMKGRYLPAERRDDLMARARASIGTVVPGRWCAGVEYSDLVEGRTAGVVYWRTLPWDHAPGVLLAAEAGLVAARPDGTGYHAADTTGGLVVATASLAEPLRMALFS